MLSIAGSKLCGAAIPFHQRRVQLQRSINSGRSRSDKIGLTGSINPIRTTKPNRLPHTQMVQRTHKAPANNQRPDQNDRTTRMVEIISQPATPNRLEYQLTSVKSRFNLDLTHISCTSKFCGRYWDRTSDPFRVKEVRYRCANRP